ncbi:hypothetical protein GOARA_038_00030 [Gordonia araii NBRC 100433]|uniref:Secreted protein n=1 Tax=Gordonia araii NBRC 100433 TaxID=1073574 RepID=G7H0T1_9ACTN|nr:hypothetical protein [Gordonia araii]NNG99206.1 hypothetical protein [Gordonia araii NBRC 100433]GAB09456.1 hypothetical protein GOARA_038_00030 [Gordonia araii NBRC 100433]
MDVMWGRRFASIVTGLLGAALVATAVSAPADAATRTVFSPTHTIGEGPLCGGTIDATATTGPRHRGSVTVFLRADLNTVFAPVPVWTCLVTATVHYRNLRTGAAGARHMTLSTSSVPRIQMCNPIIGGILCGSTGELRLRTGRGPVHAWITTSVPHLAGSARFTVF